MKNTLLIIDDEPSIHTVLGQYFFLKEFKVFSAEDGESGISAFFDLQPDVVLLDLKMPGMDGGDVLRELRKAPSSSVIIIMTAHGDIEAAVQAMRNGANHFVSKPVDLNALHEIILHELEHESVRQENRYLKQKSLGRIASEKGDTYFIPPTIKDRVQTLASSESASLLLLGETGSGKGTLAKIIHQISSRRNKPFVEVNCAGLSKELLESELFGHEKGSFTDAKERKKGLMEIADGGTLFLDEIAEAPPAVQAKILSAVESKSFRRIGGTSPLKVDVRLIFATHQDLEKEVKAGRFREDLFYRINVMPLKIPPLRDFRQQLILLAEELLNDVSSSMKKHIKGFSPATKDLLLSYNWPGNIRELKNWIEHAVILCKEGMLEPEYFPKPSSRPGTQKTANDECELLSLKEIELRHIAKVLEKLGYNQTRAAAVLGISRPTLISKIKQLKESKTVLHFPPRL